MHSPDGPDRSHLATRRFRWGFAAMLAALATLGPFSIDAYLPAFAGIQASLHATPIEIQQTLSACLFIGLGWRSVFWFLAIVGTILVAGGWRFLPETLAPGNRQPFHPVALLKGYEEVGINLRFVLLSLTVGFNFNAFFLYIVSAPA